MYRVTSCPSTDIHVKKENEEKSGLSAFVHACTNGTFATQTIISAKRFVVQDGVSV